MKRILSAIVTAMFVLTNSGTSFALRNQDPDETQVAKAVGGDMLGKTAQPAMASAVGDIQQLATDINAIANDYKFPLSTRPLEGKSLADILLGIELSGSKPMVISGRNEANLSFSGFMREYTLEDSKIVNGKSEPVRRMVYYVPSTEKLDVLELLKDYESWAKNFVGNALSKDFRWIALKEKYATPAAALSTSFPRLRSEQAAQAAGEGESGAAMSGAAGTVRELREAVEDVKKELSEAKAAKRGEWSKFKAGRKTYLEEAERLIPVGQVYSIKREKIEETLRLMKKVHYDNTAIQNTEAELEVENAQAKLAKKQQALREALAPFNNISVLVVGEAIEGNIQKQIIDYLKINYNLPEYGCKIKITNKPSISQEEIEKGEYDLMVAKNNIGQYVIMASGELEQRLRKKAGEKFEELKRQILYTPGWESDFTAIERLERALERLRSV